jgi:phage tail-like protein
MIYGATLARAKGGVDFYPQMVNADECLPLYIPRLASLLGMTIDGTLPVSDQRALIRNAVAIYRQKGTEDGLARALRSNASILDVTVDSMAKHVMVSNRFDKRSAIFIDKWAATTAYALGDIIAPSTTFGALGRVFECTTAGTSGATEPQWVPAWAATTAYQIDDVIVPTSPNGKALICTVGGTSGGTEPTWPTNFEETATDGTVTWVVRTPPLEGIGDTFTDGTVEWTTSDARTVYDWALDETGFSWEQPTVDSYGRVTAEAALYSFEVLRLWFVLAAGEEMTDEDLARIDTVMAEFAPADTRYVVRVEGP